MENANKFIKNIQINQKQRLRVMIGSLVVFNLILVGALIYLFTVLTNVAMGVISLVILGLVIWYSVYTFLSAKNEAKYELYKNKMIIKTTTYSGEIDLSTVYAVEPKKSLFDILLRKPAHSISISVKKEERNKILIRFIKEDVEKLCDEILSLAIKVRDKINKKEQRKVESSDKRIKEENNLNSK